MSTPKFRLHDTAGFPAFPFIYNEGTEIQVMTGLTIRQYFAAKALQGLLSNSGANFVSFPEDVADVAVTMADALIERLNK